MNGKKLLTLRPFPTDCLFHLLDLIISLIVGFKVSQGVDFANVFGSDVYFEANFPTQRRKRQINAEKTGQITLAQFQAIVNDKIYPGEIYLHFLENCTEMDV